MVYVDDKGKERKHLQTFFFLPRLNLSKPIFALLFCFLSFFRKRQFRVCPVCPSADVFLGKEAQKIRVGKLGRGSDNDASDLLHFFGDAGKRKVSVEAAFLWHPCGLICWRRRKRKEEELLLSLFPLAWMGVGRTFLWATPSLPNPSTVPPSPLSSECILPYTGKRRWIPPPFLPGLIGSWHQHRPCQCLLGREKRGCERKKEKGGKPIDPFANEPKYRG